MSSRQMSNSRCRKSASGRFDSLSAPGGGEGWGEVGDSRALAETHLTLPSLRDGPLPLPPEGRRGILFCRRELRFGTRRRRRRSVVGRVERSVTRRDQEPVDGGLRFASPALRGAAYRGRVLDPIRNWSTARAHCRPSRIAQTTSDWPRRISPAANIFGTEVW